MSLIFDNASSHYFTIGSSLAVPTVGAMSFWFWDFGNGVSSKYWFYTTKSMPGPYSVYLKLETGSIRAGWNVSGVSREASITASGAYMITTWTQIGWRWDASATNKCELYINGTSVATFTSSLITTTTSTPLVLGSNDATGFGNNSDMKLAEFGMWNRYLSDAEFAALGKGFSPQHFPSLVRYVPMVRAAYEAIAGNTVGDGSGGPASHCPVIYPFNAQQPFSPGGGGGGGGSTVNFKKCLSAIGGKVGARQAS